MHAGRNYSLKEVIFWTRRDIFAHLLISAIPVILYSVSGWKWLIVPWLPIALVGTAVAFVISFKNNASYERMWEARKAWGGIVNSSRAWGIMVMDYISARHAVSPVTEEELHEIREELIYRHFAWLAALRYQLREPRQWETMTRRHNAEYRQKYSVIEQETILENELSDCMGKPEKDEILSKRNRTVHIIGRQSAQLKELLDKGLIEDFRHMEMEKVLIEFYNNQGVCERIKNFPYPRQFATLNLYFVKLFVLLVPFGMLKEFENLGEHLIWLSIPFSALVSWVFTTMEKIGEATENPFEGSANDIPITAMSRTIEIDLKEMLGETDLPSPAKPVNNILT